MADDFSFFDKMRWGYHSVLNQFRSQPTNDEINSAAASIEAGPRTESAAGRGMCLIVFPGTEREDFCRNGMTNTDCEKLAKQIGGFNRTVIPGSVCPQ
jgi:hypothetical protein